MIGFRTDANENIATGHMMRCIAIAQACMALGEKCVFFVSEGTSIQHLQNRDIPYFVINSRWDCLEQELDAFWEKKWQELKGEGLELEWLVVDSYQVTYRYLEEVQKFVPVLYIDDMLKTCYPVSAVLHYGDCIEEGKCKRRYQGTNTKVLEGLMYTPLRHGFWDLYQKELVNDPINVLMTTGGTDPYHITRDFLQLALNSQLGKKIQYQVVVGSMNKDKEELRLLAEQNENITIHENVSNMAELMRMCDIAVCAGGTTRMELCACRIPIVCISFAENQRESSREMGDRGILCYAGDAELDGEKAIQKGWENVERLVASPELRRRYAEAAGKLIDGRGALRIAQFLCENKNQQKRGNDYEYSIRTSGN